MKLLLGYPFFVSGVSTPTGRFFPTHCMLCSHEDTNLYPAENRPKFRMGDGAPEITKAGQEVINFLLNSNVY